MDHSQLGGGGGGNQRPPVGAVQERRRVMEGATQQQPQQLPPQLKCPRCQSSNTKFCYYNNYSLSQPRYFCKGCRRYWTHGGTLRNVPVGGCSRKSKRPKIAEPSSSATAQQQQQHQQQLQQHHLQITSDLDKSKQNVVAHLTPIGIGANLGLMSNIGSSSSATTMAPQMIGAHYQGYGGHGFLSSLAAIQAMNHPRPPPTFTQALGGGGGGDMDSPLLRGFALPSFGIQQATNRPPSGAANHPRTWQQGLMGNVNQLPGTDPAAGSDARYWSIGSSSGSASGANNNNNDNNGNHLGSGANQHPNNLQWPDHFGGGCGLDDHA